MQDHHSLVYREEEREMFPTLNHFGVGIIPWSPLARGLLTRPFKGDIRTTRGDTDWCVRLFPLGHCNHLTPAFFQVQRWLSGRTRHRGNC